MRGIVEAHDHLARGLVESRSHRQDPRPLAFDFQHRLTLGDVAEHWTRMLVQPSLLARCENDLAHINLRYSFVIEFGGEQRPAHDRLLAHETLDEPAVWRSQQASVKRWCSSQVS